MGTTVIVMAIFGSAVLAAFFGVVLAIAAEKFKVKVDPRIEKIAEMLPNANCGGCGFPGCSGYAAAVVERNAPRNLCAPGGGTACECIAKILGETAEKTVPKVAIAACQGDSAKAPLRITYDGVMSCRGAHLLQGGPKQCLYGCLGLGDCVAACPFNAVKISENGLPAVSKTMCTGCGACVRTCPRGIMKLIPITAKFYVACSSRDKGPAVKKACSVGCIACKACEKKGPMEGAIKIEDNLPVVNYDVTLEWPAANDVCPQSCFVGEGIKTVESQAEKKEAVDAKSPVL
jgi:Na+-translocating ferredoxin:NAD+ oxidoreductase RNF subunit RnfB